MRTGSGTGPPRGEKGSKGRIFLDCIRGERWTWASEKRSSECARVDLVQEALVQEV